MNKIYGLRNDKENMTLIIGDDKAMLIIQTAESYKVRDLNLEFDVESDKSVSLEDDKIITGTRDAGKVKVVNLDGTGEKNRN